MKLFKCICLILGLSVRIVSESAFGQESLPIELKATDNEISPISDSTQVSQAWEASIRPILSRNCLECHSAIEHSGKLEMETIAGLIQGGLSGSAIDPQNPTGSLLLEVLAPKAKKHMPPEGQLNDQEIELTTWT
jgi:hypothetical protein